MHPILDQDSMTARAVTEINERFNVAEIRVVADKIEALGSDIMLCNHFASNDRDAS